MITSENAAAMAKKGNDARKAQLEELRVALTVLSGSSSDEYKARRIARVRRQIDRIDDWLLQEPDAQQVERLTNALTKLSTMERELRGEALPAPFKQLDNRKRLNLLEVSTAPPADPTQQAVSPATPQDPSAAASNIVEIG